MFRSASWQLGFALQYLRIVMLLWLLALILLFSEHLIPYLC